MTHGWSSVRGRARHLVDERAFPQHAYALCGAPIRFTSLDGFSPKTAKRLRQLEVCDHCQNAKRRAKK